MNLHFYIQFPFSVIYFPACNEYSRLHLALQMTVSVSSFNCLLRSSICHRTIISGLAANYCPRLVIQRRRLSSICRRTITSRPGEPVYKTATDCIEPANWVLNRINKASFISKFAAFLPSSPYTDLPPGRWMDGDIIADRSRFDLCQSLGR